MRSDSLSPYDLAIPAAYQRRPMMAVFGAQPMMTAGVYGATAVQPMMMAAQTMPVTTGVASTFQPAFFPVVPRM